ncbi:MAG TPA: enoyl-CoA hydratase-related protein [Thermomicrobiales bacterium]|nr:enoyl-CoA hydratase-related protein [Thermomicrobiales bacterium]
MTSFAESVRYQAEDGIVTITLDRPAARNAFDQAMAESLLAALKTAEKDEAVRVIVLTGRGDAFSAGQDLHELHAKEAQFGAQAAGDELRQRFTPVILRIRSMDLPVIAAVNGVATGAGLGIALACDLRVAAESASFICAPHGIALIPGVGITWLLPRLTGFGVASELALLGERIDARRAFELGLVNHIVADGDLQEAIHELAQRLIRQPASSLALTKRALNRSVFAGFEHHLGYEADLQEVAAGNDEHRNRLRAMIDRGSKR